MHGVLYTIEKLGGALAAAEQRIAEQARENAVVKAVDHDVLRARLAARLRDGGYPEPAGFDIEGWLVPLIVSEIQNGSTRWTAEAASTPGPNSNLNASG